MTGPRRFDLAPQTNVIGEQGAASRAGQLARLFGSRALVVTGGTATQQTGALGDVVDSLGDAGIPRELLEGVPPNPGAALVDAGARLLLATRADVIVAVGGGSVIDTAKAISIAAARPGEQFRECLSGIRTLPLHRTRTVPVIAVPTLPGSGSEGNGTCVIIDELTGRKLSAHLDIAAPRAALLDPAYALQAPRETLASCLADALCHAIEAGLSQSASSMSDALAAGAVLSLRTQAAGALDGDADAMLACLVAGTIAGQALTLAGSIITHPLAHPLSARIGTHHGAAVAALEPVVISSFSASWGPAAWRVASWLGARLPSRNTITTSDAGARALIRRLAAWNREHGVTAGVRELGVSEQLIADLVEDVLASGSRGLRNVPDGESLGEGELALLYRDALAWSPARAPRS